MQALVAHQHASCVVGHVQPFVEIEGEAVGALDPHQSWRQIRDEHGEPTERRVGVEPQPLADTEVGDRVEWVDRTGVDGAGTPDHGEWLQAGGPVRRDPCRKRLHVHGVLGIGRHETQTVAPKAQELERFRHAAMRLARSVADEPGARSCSPSRRTSPPA